MTDGLPPILRSDQRFARTLLMALAIGMGALAIMAGTAVWLSSKAQAYSDLVDHTYAAEAKIYRLQSLIERSETARRGYLLHPVGPYWALYAQTVGAIPAALEDLRRFTSDNRVQTRRLDALKPLAERKLATLSASMALAHAGDLERAQASFRGEIEFGLMRGMRAITDAMLAEEARLLVGRSAEQTGYANRLVAVVVGGVAVVASLAAGAVWAVRRYARDLQRSETALRQLNEGLEDAVRIRTLDLTRANEEIQRFAYIVSHDLRSPLVNVLGFTGELEESLKKLKRQVAAVEARSPELLDRDAKTAVDEDLPEAIGFIRSSTQKMDRLINAILKLSREGRRTLTPEPVDVATLVDGAAAALKTQSDAKQTEIVVEGVLPELVTDRLALEQVLSNLIENAVKYMAPGRAGRVAVRGRSEASRVILEVADNGRGIAARDHARVFELFRRAGVQDQAGEGIGLAHVQALVHRLGGRIELESELDRGATFRLLLPRVLVREQEAHA